MAVLTKYGVTVLMRVSTPEELKAEVGRILRVKQERVLSQLFDGSSIRSYVNLLKCFCVCILHGDELPHFQASPDLL